jgi:hypothetical protein
MEAIKPITQSITNTIKSASNSLGDLKTNVSASLNEYSSKDAISASSEFLQSNSMIAKFVFVFMIFIGFLIVLNLGIKLIGYLSQPSTQPYIVKGILGGSAGITVVQNPHDLNSTQILKSKNGATGAEFSWSSWILIDNLPTDKKYQNVFNKGNRVYSPMVSTTSSYGISTINNGPGVYLYNNNGDANLLILMDSLGVSASQSTSGDFNTLNSVIIEKLPIKKWFHIVIRLENTVMYIYINGTVSGRVQLPGVAKQNYNDIHVGLNGGFSGNISNLQYFNYALSSFEINNLVSRGPNLTISSLAESTTSSKFHEYISNSWFFSKQ